MNSLQTADTAGIQDGDHLSVVAQPAKVQGAQHAFAMWCCGGDVVVTWGDPTYGGDSSSIQNELRNVLEVTANSGAFAALLADGSVVTWGDPESGGDSSAVRGHLRNVKHIQATVDAFAAILANGWVTT